MMTNMIVQCLRSDISHFGHCNHFCYLLSLIPLNRTAALPGRARQVNLPLVTTYRRLLRLCDAMKGDWRIVYMLRPICEIAHFTK